ncbi:MAG: ABC transporter ATP-binding protein [Candidatus Korarchaeum sp.]
MPLLEIRDLRVSYKTYRGILKVLNGVNFEVEKGEKVGIIGESGCGKTTTMKAVMRILPSNAMVEGGEILYNGRDILKMSESEFNSIRRRKFAMIFQDPTAALNPVFKVGDQLIDVLKQSKGDTKKYDRDLLKEEIIAAFKEVMLPDPERVFESYPFQLSGGMRQRVCIALALMTAEELLIADEPTTNLDVTIQDQILRLIKDLVDRRDLSVILISHALGAVRGLVERVYVMYAGTMVEASEVNELFRNPKHPYSRALISSAPRLTGGGVSQGIKGNVPDYLNPPAGCRFHPRCDSKTFACELDPPELFKLSGRSKVACYLYAER